MYTMLHLSVRRMGFCMCWCMQSWCQLPILKKYAFLLFPQELVWPLEIFFLYNTLRLLVSLWQYVRVEWGC